MTSLARRLLNNPGLNALTTDDEKKEIEMVEIIKVSPSVRYETVKLQRTFNQPTLDGKIIRYWRVVGPAYHPNLYSDLSVQGLKDWGIIR